jgi:hypothetical protein
VEFDESIISEEKHKAKIFEVSNVLFLVSEERSMRRGKHCGGGKQWRRTDR